MHPVHYGAGDSLVRRCPREEEQRLSKSSSWDKTPVKNRVQRELHGEEEDASPGPVLALY